MRYSGMVIQRRIGENVEGSDGGLMELLFWIGHMAIEGLKDATIRVWDLPTS